MNELIKALLKTPPNQVPEKAFLYIRRRWHARRTRRKDHNRTTFLTNVDASGQTPFHYFKAPEIDNLLQNRDSIRQYSTNILAHRFDLLGSGWQEVEHGAPCKGMEQYLFDMGSTVQADPQGNWLKDRINTSNLYESQKIWSLVTSGYKPIDWQLDFKSGYRWRENQWHRDILFGNTPGQDIKVPWELARFQHLPTLSWAYALAMSGEPDFESPGSYLEEFQNQVLDFFANNPPRFGANWCCAMDVGIRIANIWVAYDLFASQNANLNISFTENLIRSTHEHLQFILENLEWNPGLRSNHYLGNLMGLLYGSAHLPTSPNVDAILAFSVQELVRAMDDQFLPDGGNFEGSTCYHRLSGEMMAYGTALILGLPEEKQKSLKNYDATKLKQTPPLQICPLPHFPISDSSCTSPFPPSYFERLKKIADFSEAAIKPAGDVVQFGDNDSGRFLKLQPVFNNNESFSENILNTRHLSSAIHAVFGKVEKKSFDAIIISKIISSPIPYPAINEAPSLIGESSIWDRHINAYSSKGSSQKSERVFKSESGEITSEISLMSFPDFGLFIFRSDHLYAAVRCGPVGQNGHGGHAHNDALNLELTLNGNDILFDPGSYCYTPLQVQRNAYRSSHAHFVPRIPGKEPNPLSEGLFALPDRSQAQCLYFGPRGFIGTHKGFGSPVVRMIEIQKDCIVVRDYYEGDASLLPLEDYQPPPFSKGYGKRTG